MSTSTETLTQASEHFADAWDAYGKRMERLKEDGHLESDDKTITDLQECLLGVQLGLSEGLGKGASAEEALALRMALRRRTRDRPGPFTRPNHQKPFSVDAWCRAEDIERLGTSLIDDLRTKTSINALSIMEQTAVELEVLLAVQAENLSTMSPVSTALVSKALEDCQWLAGAILTSITSYPTKKKERWRAFGKDLSMKAADARKTLESLATELRVIPSSLEDCEDTESGVEGVFIICNSFETANRSLRHAKFPSDAGELREMLKHVSLIEMACENLSAQGTTVDDIAATCS